LLHRPPRSGVSHALRMDSRQRSVIVGWRPTGWSGSLESPGSVRPSTSVSATCFTWRTPATPPEQPDYLVRDRAAISNRGRQAPPTGRTFSQERVVCDKMGRRQSTPWGASCPVSRRRQAHPPTRRPAHHRGSRPRRPACPRCPRRAGTSLRRVGPPLLRAGASPATPGGRPVRRLPLRRTAVRSPVTPLRATHRPGVCPRLTSPASSPCARSVSVTSTTAPSRRSGRTRRPWSVSGPS